MKTYCVSVIGFPALADNAKLIKNFHKSMDERQYSAQSDSFNPVSKVA